MGQFPAQQYKIEKVKTLIDPTPQKEFQTLLNTMSAEGWRLHSLVPQADDGGETSCNIAIFEKK
ncbi:hypothetical protein CBW65_23685 [Tumebacillus avium]|uniref:DUF4177 domain-containing protein n=1 Tax=Tumebacillus avium TaxID=1903704 RepID=A0A1Y0ITC0_9BACL|nr:DUF4177 domain-containing protein [Tumebacillus avium]ARU63687.1 hypothetical protein CBW65_23685 [Tumebacillus avium]